MPVDWYARSVVVSSIVRRDRLHQLGSDLRTEVLARVEHHLGSGPREFRGGGGTDPVGQVRRVSDRRAEVVRVGDGAVPPGTICTVASIDVACAARCQTICSRSGRRSGSARPRDDPKPLSDSMCDREPGALSATWRTSGSLVCAAKGTTETLGVGGAPWLAGLRPIKTHPASAALITTARPQQSPRARSIVAFGTEFAADSASTSR